MREILQISHVVCLRKIAILGLVLRGEFGGRLLQHVDRILDRLVDIVQQNV